MKFLREYLTEVKLSRLSKTSKSLCGPSSLQAFGICYNDSNAVLKDHEIIRELENAGYKVKSLPRYPFKGYTLGQFTKEFETGSYILATSGHVMAYIDGELTDTAHTKRALSKKLVGVYEVTK